MVPFRTEIRNSPKEQTIKVYLNDISLDQQVKAFLNKISDIKLIEIQNSVAQNRAEENLTVFKKEGVDINQLKKEIDQQLGTYFSN